MHRRQTRTWRLLFRQKKNDEPAAERMSHTMPALCLHLVPSMEMCRQPIRFWRCTDSLSESGSGGWRRSQCTGVFPGSILWILLSAASASDVCTTGILVLGVMCCSYSQSSQYFGRQYCSTLSTRSTYEMYSDAPGYTRSMKYTGSICGGGLMLS